MITTLKIKKAFDLIDAYALTAVALKGQENTIYHQQEPLEKAHAEAQASMEAYLGSFVVPTGRRKSAYVCNGCGGLYWDNNINCDCNIPYMNEHKMTRVTVVAQKPFNAFVKKVNQDKKKAKKK
jgi:hypothetical protein